MRTLALFCAVAAPLALAGCVSLGPLGAERGQGTSRLIHASRDRILAAAERQPPFYHHNPSFLHFAAVSDAIYMWFSDPLSPMRLAVMTYPTDSNGDTRTEVASSRWFPEIDKPAKEQQLLDAIARDAQSGGAEPPEAAAPADEPMLSRKNTAITLKRQLSGRAPAPPQAEPANPARAEYDSDVDRPRGRLPQNPAAFAVVIGVEKYSNDLPDAKFAQRDAQAVRAALVALGYPERNIKYLTGARATKSNLEAYIEDWLPRNVKAGGKVFVYFSGHGAPDPQSNQAYLVPIDGDPNYLDKTAYPVKKLYASLNKLKADQIIVALDSCFSGAGGRSVLAEGARPLVTKIDASVARDGRITLFAAASPSEITSTLDDQGHGVFTYYFLKGLEGAAQDKSGAVTARGLYDYLKPQVQDAASRENRDQTPLLEGVADRELVDFN